jgi:hypothetical protein
MSLFGNIMSAIFGRSAGAAAQEPAATGSKTAPKSTTVAAAPDAKATAPAAVDVAAVLDELASHKKQKLHWRKSIVDLMKLLDLDSGLAARKRLAEELHYAGNTKSSAAMNIWLHKQVMIKLAENGGKVPEELKR